MTVVVTRDVAARTRGFLSSCMLEVAPGVYTSPRMTSSVRDRIQAVLAEWWQDAPEGSALMTWPDREAAGGQALWYVGTPRTSIVDAGDELYLVKRADI